jgi:hypothetical protein
MAAELPPWRDYCDVRWELELSADQIDWAQGFDQSAFPIDPGGTTSIFYRITNDQYSLEPLTLPWADTSPVPGDIPTWAYTSFRDYTSGMASAMDGLLPGETAYGVACEFDWMPNIGPVWFGDGWAIRAGVGNSSVDYDQTAIDYDIGYDYLRFEYSPVLQMNQEAQFLASRSNLVDLYRWDFEGDGTWDTGWSSDRSASHTYEQIGCYRPVLQASGFSGLYEADGSIECTPEPSAVVLLLASGAIAGAIRRRRTE